MSTSQADTRDDHDGAATAPPVRGVRTFTIVWCGQFVAVTSLTVLNFAAAFYFYDKYPLPWLGIMFALPFIPFLVSSPFSGSFIDRWGVKRALLVSNIGGILLAASLVVPFLTGDFSVWHAFAVIMIVPILKSLLLPAIETSVTLLVPKRHIGRANGTRMLVNGLGAVLGPIAAGLLINAIGLGGIGLLVAVLLALAVLTVAAVRIPLATRQDAADSPARSSLAAFKEAWDQIKVRHGMVALMVFFGVVSFGIGFVEVLLPGLVLAFAPETSLAAVLAVGALGMTLTGVAMTIWGGPRRRVNGMLGWTLLFAAAMVLGGLRPNIVLIAVAAFVFLGTTSIIIGSFHTVLNTKVEPELLGRVMALKNVVYAGLLMLGNVTAGVLSGALQPLVGEDQVRSRVVAALVGDGGNRGFALLMLAAGVVVALCTLYAYRHRRLNGLEDALPDVTPEDLAGVTPADPARR
ncbi:MFS transporter [Sphaerisporangium rubeum]|uniref:MFS family permease n=1 Tax=Sphaerisporangium rubeum TaxID=321317 RepID=A0A7X0I975_9ACTN|nr:MFS transporter [Sphaerisporangium rubeum]MBB6470940.1 MFS family permease [Sphaerisporangium rubeum]